MAMYVVRALKPIKKGTKHYHDMLCKPLTEDAPPGRRLRMEQDQAIKAAMAGDVEMLSPGGLKDLANAEAIASAPTSRRKPTYKTRVETPDTAA